MNIETPESEPEPAYSRMQQIQFTIARRKRNKFSYGQYVNEWSKVEEEVVPNITIPDTQLFLGFTSPDYSTANVVAPEISIIANEGGKMVPKSRVFIILGKKGGGKSILMSNIALDNFRRKFGIPTIIVDPAGEYHFKRNPLTKQFTNPAMQKRFGEYEYQFDTRFTGYNIRTIKPKFDSVGFVEEGIDDTMQLCLSDFKELFKFSPLDAIQSVINVLELEDSRPAEFMVSSILTNPSVHSFGEVDRLINNKELRDEEFKVVGTAFSNYLKQSLMLGILSPEEYSPSKDIVNQVIENDALNLRSKFKFSEDSKIFTKYLIYLKVAFTKIMADRLRYTQGTKEEKIKARLTHPLGLQFVIDEIDTLAGVSGTDYLGTMIERFSTKMRKDGFTIIGACQDASRMNQTLLAQADGIFVGRLDSKGNIDALRQRGISDEAVEILKHLEIERKNSYGFNVSEFAYINQKNQIISFFPCLPLASFKG